MDEPPCYVGQYASVSLKLTDRYLCCCLGELYCILYCVLQYTTAPLQVLFSSCHLGGITKGHSNNYNSESLLYIYIY